MASELGDEKKGAITAWSLAGENRFYVSEGYNRSKRETYKLPEDAVSFLKSQNDKEG